ncbi:Site-specific recombinase XerD [Qipengyuania nanhaisediminis]|uniref:Site-specific recombinase XerD n=1 Tax=Qipengyuania nanhaisediminis TaxID=604088 RepID=A0A1I5NXW8_9SPHN|nr:Site-specific recombinase XerD [Qipengyuania nanhaisediminis]
MGKLTQARVDKAEQRAKQYFIWDRDLKGFGLRISPGGAKSYVIQYRMGGRGFPAKRYTIGKHDSPWTTVAARGEAKRLLAEIELGNDPKDAEEERRADQLHSRFEQFANQFLELYGEREWAPNNYKNQKGYLSNWIVPIMGKKPLGTIKRKDVVAVLDKVPANKPSLPRNLFVLMRLMFNWAVDRGALEKSPIAGMKPPRQPSERHHILAHDELILLAAYAERMGPVWGNLIHMLLLTGQRRNEVARADWSEFNKALRLWTIPPARTKNGREQIVPLNAGAMACLNELAGRHREGDGDAWPKRGYVFFHHDGKPVSGFSRMKRRLDKGLASASTIEMQPWRFHDLRRTVATNMQQLGVRFEVTEALLNHVSVTHAGVASVYHRHDWLDEKRSALEAWSARLAQLTEDWDGFLPDAKEPKS